MTLAGLRQLAQRIATERRRVHDVIIGLLRVEHAEPVVVFGGDHQVPLAGSSGERRPRVGVKLDRVELTRERFVLRNRNARAVHDPLADSGDVLAVPFAGRNRVQPPMDKQPEARLAEPVQTWMVSRIQSLF